MYSTGIKNSFTARHKLIGDFGEESLPHEHSYVIEWICTVSELDENGFGVNIDILNDKLEKVTESLNKTFLNDLAFFKGKQTSIENTAQYITETLFKELANESYPVSTIEQSEVKIWESDTAWASYLQH
jgi:6-pyruvoyl-tetrahydropterin synthase